MPRSSPPLTTPNPARTRHNPPRATLSRTSPARLCRLAALLLFAAFASAQTLARPGLAGSGLNTDPWWAHAVFYRIAPRPEDLTHEVDFKAMAAKLDALQSLGIDALIVPVSYTHLDVYKRQL